ncbi:MAG: FG-GAP-like repeat-containing protein [Phycisphaerales bacterium]
MRRLARRRHLNADGTVDVAVANSGIVGFDPGNARILTNNGSGAFANATVLTTGFNPVSIAVAHLNGDNFLDLVTANSESSDISVFLRDASALTTVAGTTFLPPRKHETSPRPVEIIPGGLSNPKDLDNDLAVACLGNTPGSGGGTVDVLRNLAPGTGDLAPSVPLPISNVTGSLAVLDMDNDNDSDIAVLAQGTGPNTGANVVRVLRNDTANAGTGQLTFALQPGEISANSPTLIRSGDVNNDGQNDLVTINSGAALRPTGGDPERNTNPISVIRTSAPPPLCPGDLNNDNQVNTTDLVAFLGRFGTTVPPYTQGDLNGSGTVNTADLVIFLGRFGQPCP